MGVQVGGVRGQPRQAPLLALVHSRSPACLKAAEGASVMQASLDPTPPCFFPLSSLTPLSPPIATTASVYVFKWNVESFENIIFISIQFGHTTTGNDGKAAYRFGASGLKPFTSQGMAPLIPFGIISQAYLLSSVFPHILELSSLKILQFCHPSSFTSLVLFVLESSVPFSANSRLLIR